MYLCQAAQECLISYSLSSPCVWKLITLLWNQAGRARFFLFKKTFGKIKKTKEKH